MFESDTLLLSREFEVTAREREEFCGIILDVVSRSVSDEINQHTSTGNATPFMPF